MLPALLLIPLVALFRILCAWQTTAAGSGVWSWLPGFCPLSAIAFCAGAYLPRRLAFVLPLGILLLSDVFIDAHYGVSLWTAQTLGHYGALALSVSLGLALRRAGGKVSATAALLGTLAASVLFYVVTSTLSWTGPASGYVQTLAGWAQALTIGLPGYPPSLYFFRNSLVSDLLYSILFLACLRLGEKRSSGVPAAAVCGASRAGV